MKLNLLFIAILLAFAFRAEARDLTFAWEASPSVDVTSYEFYELAEDGVTGIQIGESLDDPDTPEADPPLILRLPAFPDTTTSVYVIPVNSVGIKGPRSNILVVTPTPEAAGTLQVTQTPEE